MSSPPGRFNNVYESYMSAYHTAHPYPGEPPRDALACQECFSLQLLGSVLTSSIIVREYPLPSVLLYQLSLYSKSSMVWPIASSSLILSPSVGQTAGILAGDIDVGTVSSRKSLLVFYHHNILPYCKVDVGKGEVNSVGKLHQIQIERLGSDVLSIQ